jgi:pyruvate-formate lyase-activating enzyme
MPYHRMGSTKYAALDKPYELEEIQIMPGPHVDAVAQMYRNYGISCSVSR